MTSKFGASCLRPKFFTQEKMWKRELNSLTVLLHSNIVQIKYVIYDGADRKHHEDSVGYVMECIHCPWLDCSKTEQLAAKASSCAGDALLSPSRTLTPTTTLTWASSPKTSFSTRPVEVVRLRLRVFHPEQSFLHICDAGHTVLYGP